MSVLDGPGEGTWSVFALQVVEQRDALAERLEQMTRERDEAQAQLATALKKTNNEHEHENWKVEI